MEEAIKTEYPIDPQREALRRAVRYFYDLQKLRIAAGNRTADPDAFTIVEDKKNPGKTKKVKKGVTKAQMDEALTAVLHSIRGDIEAEQGAVGESKAPPTLDEADRLYLQRQNRVLMSLEADTLKRVSELLTKIPIAAWLGEQKGIGVTMAGVLISEINIHRCETPSALWAYAGLHTDAETGAAVRRRRGQVANWNSFLKTKSVKVMAECMIKANSPWRSFYDSYKMRKMNQRVETCMLCLGSGKIAVSADGEETSIADAPKGVALKGKSCSNCSGTGGPAPWGRSQAHRDQAAKRYMVKMFLLEFWKKWRAAEGLTLVPSYAEAMLGRMHGDHGGAGLTSKGERFRPAPRRDPAAHP